MNGKSHEHIENSGLPEQNMRQETRRLIRHGERASVFEEYGNKKMRRSMSRQQNWDQSQAERKRRYFTQAVYHVIDGSYTPEELSFVFANIKWFEDILTSNRNGDSDLSTSFVRLDESLTPAKVTLNEFSKSLGDNFNTGDSQE